MEEIKNRKHIRFKPDPNTLITLKLQNGTLIKGVAFSEARGGCAGIFHNNSMANELKIGEILTLEVGGITFELAEIRWINIVDIDVIKVGFEDKS